MPVLTPSLLPPGPKPTQPRPSASLKSPVPRVPVPETPADNDRDSESPITQLRLDVDSISAALASALATSFVSHVLFLKNQVPFPIAQLYRLPSGKSTPRAVKQRTELLASFDTLASHLDTTFTALSTAMALCRRDAQVDWEQAEREDGGCRAQMAILVGPSIAAPKAKVLFVVDGLAAKVWGERDDSDDEDEEEESEDGSDEESDEEPGPPDSDSESDEGSEGDSDEAPPPPKERTRTPFSPVPSTAPVSGSRGPHAPKQLESEEEQQQLVRTATRELSHAMATAESLADELGTTQTHILIHAPRRFKHPAWIPRPTAGNAMDRAVDAFLTQDADSKLKPKRGQKVEGVWVKCRRAVSQHEEQRVENEEENEMIWWTWDGKLVGLSEW
ncbi:hypothetical protein HMN09_00326300 [Mycena chlorophos]|uniref:Uncharacterized protein n=1 Tax=Mycena chlorophos TaxID=658473 RepID=A0A8H6WII7_MYCCL|nr:hypothetical protein HMN09_00326300 [Mycena chlorophos]